MELRLFFLFISCWCFNCFIDAQLLFSGGENFTKADTLRGSITAYRKGWDVLQYNLTIKPDITTKSITGKNTITYFESSPAFTMQIDLQQPLIVDSITGNNTKYRFMQDGNFCFVTLKDSLAKYKFLPGVRSLSIYYHGAPTEAKRAPWDGGLVWANDSMGSPFIATACQGLGASVWYPCKDHQSDEPDSGMIINIIAPDTLVAVSNGRLTNTSQSTNGYKTWTWRVRNPINNYGVTLNIGKYTHFNDTLMGEGGKLDLDYWVINYNLEKAKKQFQQVKPMLHSHEYWFGKYPFYEDGYKLVETPFLGMEHQSAVAYGNHYKNGYLGRDLSGTGWGLKWDFIIIHESGHEWFGNNITSKDVADMWIHESFTNYSETLYTEYMFGRQAANEYCRGTRSNIRNDINIIGYYGVNKEGSGDMYYKGGNMLHIIRNTINDDKKFRDILRGLNRTFYHKTVTTKQIEDYISQQSRINFAPAFDQYLRTTQIPVLEYYVNNNSKKLFLRWTNCNTNFNLVLKGNSSNKLYTIAATTTWKNIPVDNEFATSFPDIVDSNYYVGLKKVK